MNEVRRYSQGLPGVGASGVAETKVDHARDHGEDPGGRVPDAQPRRLLLRLVPQSRDGDESRAHRALGKTKEEALGDKALVVVADDGEDANDTPDADDEARGFGQGSTGKDQRHGKDGDDVAIVELRRSAKEDGQVSRSPAGLTAAVAVEYRVV